MQIPKIRTTKILQCKDCVHCDERGKESYCYQKKVVVNAKQTACKNVDVRRPGKK